MRFLIKPPPGHGLAYIDFAAQEFGIAAALSGDPAMIAAYTSNDVYIGFGKQIGKLPADATAETHASARQLFKQCVLGIGYGMEERTLAQRIGQPPIVARELLRAYRETYAKFWAWADGAVDYAMLHGSLHTTFGWPIHVDESPNPRSLRNFLLQGNASEMLRLSCIFATERSVEVCAPIHDALLICAPLDRLEADIATTRAAMTEASRLVLDGFEIRTDVKVVRYPDRYTDRRGAVMWRRIMALIEQRQAKAVAA
jgi:DNA polymerase-1